jgi:aspartyl-tRNA(Asn)/glutamyl-tRNA(Gln) amidotransferase subunit A
VTGPRHTVASAAAALRASATTPTALLADCLERIEAWEPRLRALTTLTADRALAAATAAERELAAGRDRGPLHGVPVLVKDLVDVEGVPTTGGSAFLRANVATADAPVVRRLREAGAVLVGKANTHEFAFGALTPPTRNPWDLERMPGGSSGGSGAAVAAGLVPAALGTDTAGSVREPAALCGLVGLKPTFGRVSCRGVLPLAWSLDTVGPMTATVEDCRILFSVLEGPDPGYASTASRSTGAAPPRPGPEGLRVGVVAELLAPLQSEVEEPLRALLGRLAGAGADVREVAIGDVDELIAVTFVILGAEALSYHRPWLERHPERYSPDVLAYLRLADRYTAADYVDAQRLRAAFRDRVDALLAATDVLVSPAQMVLAPRVEDETVAFPGGGEAPRDLTLIRPLAPFSLSGHPAVSLPVARAAQGLPVGVQLVGAAFRDEELLDVAGAVAALTPWDLALPALPHSR